MKSAVENEVRVISSLMQIGPNINVVRIYRHGWMKDYFNLYSIDMELCDFTLSDYIEYRVGKNKDVPLNVLEAPPPNVLVAKDASAVQLACNVWTIGIHVARGLDFLHSNNYVHRDVKPRNSIISPR